MRQPPENTEALIACCLRGDQAGYSGLYDQYAPVIYRLCYGLLMNRQDAEDVMQEAFVYAFKNLRRYDSKRASFKTWLYTIAISRCRNLYRRRPPLIDWSYLLNLAGPRSETPEAALAEHNARQMVEQALGTLTPLLREAVILRYGHGLTYREMADIVGCPQKTAESRVRLAHERLRTLLQPSGQHILDELVGI